jgi:hypothetical protein
MESIHEKTRGQKSHASVPLSRNLKKLHRETAGQKYFYIKQVRSKEWAQSDKIQYTVMLDQQPGST